MHASASVVKAPSFLTDDGVVLHDKDVVELALDSLAQALQLQRLELLSREAFYTCFRVPRGHPADVTSEQAQPLLGDLGVCFAAIGSVDAVPFGVWPEQHVAEAILVGHDRIATDHGVAALTLLRIRIEAPVAGSELLHGSRNIREVLFVTND